MQMIFRKNVWAYRESLNYIETSATLYNANLGGTHLLIEKVYLDTLATLYNANALS